VSSNVARVAWVQSGHQGARRARLKEADGEPLGSLYVEWVTGRISHYDDVPQSVHEALLEVNADPAGSVGTYVHQQVKPAYDHTYLSIVNEGS
jgi:hypothetical protein